MKLHWCWLHIHSIAIQSSVLCSKCKTLGWKLGHGNSLCVGLTLQSSLVPTACGCPVGQQLVPEAHGPSAPRLITLGSGLEVDDRPVDSVRRETHYLLWAGSISGQQLQPSRALKEHAGPAQRWRRFDADSGAQGVG